MLLLAAFCISVSVLWGIFRNEDQWAWVLQDALGIAFCLYILKTIRLPTFKGCTLLLMVLFVYDVFFVFITPFLTKTGESIMVEVAAGPPDSATHEKLPMVLKVPRLNSSPLALCDRPFSLLGFGDILVPASNSSGLLVAYCHRFDIQVQSSRVYFVACTIAYGIGLLVTFVALALMQMGQPALLYLVPCTLITSFAVALWRKELTMFWTGSGFAVNTFDMTVFKNNNTINLTRIKKDLPHPPLVLAPVSCPEPPKDVNAPASQQEAEQMTNPTLHAKEQSNATLSVEEAQNPSPNTGELTGPSTQLEQPKNSSSHIEESANQNKDNCENRSVKVEKNQLD
ncbi:PREDICTED: signal peptide peptidase-like 2B [Crocodylus porosus]|uniref:signal peptide peptidase-like 2B n=1 Tax=Crocodylus porosus TaxID=8502 RepID=UPI0009405D31|nr:PREDICTED: signal peptide peptidase-like 2B [Crocodylus porosus]